MRGHHDIAGIAHGDADNVGHALLQVGGHVGSEVFGFFDAKHPSGLFVIRCLGRSRGDRTAHNESPIQYQSYSCAQLREEAARVSARAAEASGAQNQKANNDAIATGVGAVLFWPALFFIKGTPPALNRSRN